MQPSRELYSFQPTCIFHFFPLFLARVQHTHCDFSNLPELPLQRRLMHYKCQICMQSMFCGHPICLHRFRVGRAQLCYCVQLSRHVIGGHWASRESTLKHSYSSCLSRGSSRWSSRGSCGLERTMQMRWLMSHWGTFLKLASKRCWWCWQHSSGCATTSSDSWN